MFVMKNLNQKMALYKNQGPRVIKGFQVEFFGLGISQHGNCIRGIRDWTVEGPRLVLFFGLIRATMPKPPTHIT